MKRQTKQRQAVLEVLTDINEFRSAQQLFVDLKERGHSIGLATVYRNLDVLCQSGEVEFIRAEDGEALYRRCTVPHHHHHLVCRNCGLTIHLESEPLEKWLHSIAKQHGFTEVSHSADMFGLCQECATETASKSN